jgi:hypothetical protein
LRQSRDAHWRSAVHAAPKPSQAAQTPPLQNVPLTQSVSIEHEVLQLTPSAQVRLPEHPRFVPALQPAAEAFTPSH